MLWMLDRGAYLKNLCAIIVIGSDNSHPRFMPRERRAV